MTSSRFSISSRGMVPASRTDPAAEPHTAPSACKSPFFAASRKASTAPRGSAAPVALPVAATAGCGAGDVVRAGELAHAASTISEAKVAAVNFMTAVLPLSATAVGGTLGK